MSAPGGGVMMTDVRIPACAHKSFLTKHAERENPRGQPEEEESQRILGQGVADTLLRVVRRHGGILQEQE